LDQLPPEKASQSAPFRGQPIPVLDLIFNAVVHQAEHTAQILYIAKQRLSSKYQNL
jgi:hypothetical protein